MEVVNMVTVIGLYFEAEGVISLPVHDDGALYLSDKTIDVWCYMVLSCVFGDRC